MKSTCITGILEAEAVYMMEYVRMFIDTTDDLVFQETPTALYIPVTQNGIGLTEEQELVYKVQDKIQTESQTTSCENRTGCPTDESSSFRASP